MRVSINYVALCNLHFPFCEIVESSNKKQVRECSVLCQFDPPCIICWTSRRGISCSLPQLTRSSPAVDRLNCPEPCQAQCFCSYGKSLKVSALMYHFPSELTTLKQNNAMAMLSSVSHFTVIIY